MSSTSQQLSGKETGDPSFLSLARGTAWGHDPLLGTRPKPIGRTGSVGAHPCIGGNRNVRDTFLGATVEMCAPTAASGIPDCRSTQPDPLETSSTPATTTRGTRSAASTNHHTMVVRIAFNRCPQQWHIQCRPLVTVGSTRVARSVIDSVATCTAWCRSNNLSR